MGLQQGFGGEIVLETGNGILEQLNSYGCLFVRGKPWQLRG